MIQDLSSWLNFDEIQWALKYPWMTSQIKYDSVRAVHYTTLYIPGDYSTV